MEDGGTAAALYKRIVRDGGAAPHPGPGAQPAVAYRLQECCGDKSYALTECSSNHTAKAAVSV
jgi:hypothetical protein